MTLAVQSELALSFIVPGQPVPCARPRVVRSKKTGKVHTFTPKTTQDYKRSVAMFALVARQAVRRTWPLDAEYRVEIVVELATRRRGDADNYAKACLDACNGLLWKDDRQVVRLVTDMRQASAPAMSVLVEVVGSEVAT